ncbi:tldc domain-containing protein [Stylonychia lemnae]|uniref:Tldc domain-containing protein n=1 Tax=Stylonychia lemnae TaxID=5949 RepID=A0A078AJS1_STYLE|nr:tldc domain-containing protein [Stylonychia lemnae]|eukprot:CDW81058.1 tldc domain-containing protein [Stylonychia lemnae]
MCSVIPLMNNLEKLNTINIICDKHPQKLVKTYCQTTHQLLCSICSNACLCINQKNSDHQNVLRKDMEDYIQLKIPMLKNLLERIQVIIQSLTQYQNKDKMFKASDFLDLITQINKFQNPEQSVNDLSLFHNELQSRMSTLENLENIQILQPIQQNDKYAADLLQMLSEPDKPKYYRRLVDFHIETLRNQQIKGICKLLPLNGQCKLIFKATNDGFTASNFHQKCDNKGPTISFIQSEHGQVFGGYTTVSWTTPDNNNKLNNDNDAFVFSLSKNTLHKQYQNFDNAVLHYKDWLMLFGSSHDIFISNDCNNNSNSGCNLGYTYMPPQGFKYGDQQSKDYLGGSKEFKVIEIEVYQVLV